MPYKVRISQDGLSGDEEPSQEEEQMVVEVQPTVSWALCSTRKLRLGLFRGRKQVLKA